MIRSNSDEPLRAGDYSPPPWVELPGPRGGNLPTPTVRECLTNIIDCLKAVWEAEQREYNRCESLKRVNASYESDADLDTALIAMKLAERDYWMACKELAEYDSANGVHSVARMDSITKSERK